MFLYLDVDFLSIQQPHQEEPQQDEGDGVGERGVDGLKDGEEDVVDDHFLDRDARSVGGGDLVGGHHPGEEAGKDKQREGVYAENYEGFGPRFVAFDIDEPVAKSEREKSEARRHENVGTGPEGFVERKIAVPDPAQSEQNAAEEKDAADFVEG